MSVFRVAETAKEERGTLGFLEDDEMLIWGPWGDQLLIHTHTHTRAVTSAHAAKSKKPDCEALE